MVGRPEEQSALRLCFLRYLLFKISSRAAAAFDADHGGIALEAEIHPGPLLRDPR
jgi:hypothetical protein